MLNIKVVPDKRRETVQGKYPLKLRLTYKRERKYYSIGKMVSEDEWQSLNSEKAKGKLRHLRNELTQIEVMAQETAEKIVPFSFILFERQYFESPQVTDLNTILADCYNEYIEGLIKNQQIKTAKSYSNSFKSLNAYKPNLTIFDITVEFLQQYEIWMLSNKKSRTTIGIYTRCLRTIMNVLKSESIITEQAYPFGRKKYMIPKGNNTKKALSIEQIKAIFNFEIPAGEHYYYQRRSKDFWIFSYLASGMNFNDIAKLKWENFDQSSFTFLRSKTIRTNKANPHPITVLLNEQLNRIIKSWSTDPKTSKKDDYVFKIINKTDSQDQIATKIDQFIKVTNRWMNQIGKKLKIEAPITTYVARHSFATITITNGNAPIEFVSQCLGHASILTTQHYFAGFNPQKQAEYNSALLNF